MKLYEIAAQYNALLEMADDESISPELLADTLEDIQDAFEEKADNIACVIKSVRAAAEAIRKEANELNLRLKRKEKIADSLTEYLKAQLEAVGKTKVETARNVISVAKKPASVEIENPRRLYLVDIELQYKLDVDAEWSEPIPGTGGSKFVAAEKGNTLRASDECFKMALTDAISVACKALGFGADIYWAAGRTKYSAAQSEEYRKDGARR